MRLLIPIFFPLLLWLPRSYAQAADSIVIRGWVLDEQKQSVGGAIIQLQDSTRSLGAAITGRDGKFKIRIEKFYKPEITEIVLYPGYVKQTIVLGKDNRDIYQDIILQPDPNSEFESAPMQPPPLVDSFEAVRTTITGNGKQL